MLGHPAGGVAVPRSSALWLQSTPFCVTPTTLSGSVAMGTFVRVLLVAVEQVCGLVAVSSKLLALVVVSELDDDQLLVLSVALDV